MLLQNWKREGIKCKGLDRISYFNIVLSSHECPSDKSSLPLHKRKVLQRPKGGEIKLKPKNIQRSPSVCSLENGEAKETIYLQTHWYFLSHSSGVSPACLDTWRGTLKTSISLLLISANFSFWRRTNEMGWNCRKILGFLYLNRWGVSQWNNGTSTCAEGLRASNLQFNTLPQ